MIEVLVYGMTVGMQRRQKRKFMLIKNYSLKNKEQLPLLVFPEWDRMEGIRHCFTTRKGGVSEGCLSSLNLGWNRGDADENVEENYRRVAEYFGCRREDFVGLAQIHSDRLRVIRKEEAMEHGPRAWDRVEADGLVTNAEGLVLLTMHADCTPLYFYDPKKRVIALVHSGWKGTLLKIGAKAVSTMTQEFGCAPSDIYAAIGPVICRSCYEVSEDVALPFRQSGVSEALFSGKREGKYQLDLTEANRLILLSAGIREEHLTIGSVCTCCQPELLFSHRATGGKRGNCGALLMMLERPTGPVLS